MISRDVRRGRSYQMLTKLFSFRFNVIGKVGVEIREKCNLVVKGAESGKLGEDQK